MACTGQGWEQIRAEWDLPRLVAWNKYAAEHPPVHIMVAAYLGIKPKRRESGAPQPDVESELLTMPGGFQTAEPPRPIRRDLMPWLKETST